MAVDFGADALGFVFWPGSPRFIDPFRARLVVARLPPLVGVVGVFVDQPADYVNGVAALAHLTAVQLHGGEDPAYAAAMTRPVIKAVNGAAAGEAGWPDPVTLLVDAHDLEKRGGTGRLADWSEAARVARSRRVLLAGGLTADNIKSAVAQVRPFGVDVSSGVESSPGIKDRNRMAAFFKVVRP
ncbi:MAG: N-(5'-phosphoribosyl)anthranilate isomerase [Luteitalea sp.]|nr:N-(5'-phosphoribosyl)anthranilate isomerase [Luteitalea sp.]